MIIRSRVPRNELIAVATVGLIALLPRLTLALITPPSVLVYDMKDYWDRAVYIAEHARLYENSYRMPGYPAALAAIFAIGTGPSLTAARVFNAAAGTVGVLLTYGLARRTARPRASLAAALAVALYPSFVIYTAFIATEAVVAAPLLAALIASSYRSRAAAIVAGLCAGLTTLVRPACVTVLPAVLVAFLWTTAANSTRRTAWVNAGLLVAAFVLTMSPWWVHNARLHKRFVPFDTSGGMNLAVGNHPQASGTYRFREFGPMLARRLPGVDIFTLEGSDRATRVALEYMRENPGHVVRLMPAKLAALFALEGREHAFFYSFGYFGELSARTVRLSAYVVVLTFPLLLVAALAGLAVRSGIDPRVLAPSVIFIAATAVVHLISFGDPRYHLPMVPVLAVLATGLARAANGFSRVRLAAAGVVLLLLSVAWRAQFDNYWVALPKLAAPGGSISQITYDDLM